MVETSDAAPAKRSPLRWVLIALPPVVAIVAVGWASGPAAGPGTALSASVGSQSPLPVPVARQGVTCETIEPAAFEIAPGARQRLDVKFTTASSGRLEFRWSASVGGFAQLDSDEQSPSLGGFVALDDFDDGVLDEELWQVTVAPGARLAERGGTLHILIPAGPAGHHVRLAGKFSIEGGFGAEVTIPAMHADAHFGTAGLVFDTQNGAQAHVQVEAEVAAARIEANTKNADGTWQASRAIPAVAGPASLRLVRGGTQIRYDAYGNAIGEGWAELGAEPGTIGFGAWSLGAGPEVSVEFDNFGAGHNTLVDFVAPQGASVGDRITIQISESCQSVATVVGVAAVAPDAVAPRAPSGN